MTKNHDYQLKVFPLTRSSKAIVTTHMDYLCKQGGTYKEETRDRKRLNYGLSDCTQPK